MSGSVITLGQLMSNSDVLLILVMSLNSTLAKPTIPLGRGKMLDKCSSIPTKIKEFINVKRVN